MSAYFFCRSLSSMVSAMSACLRHLCKHLWKWLKRRGLRLLWQGSGGDATAGPALHGRRSARAACFFLHSSSEVSHAWPWDRSDSPFCRLTLEGRTQHQATTSAASALCSVSASWSGSDSGGLVGGHVGHRQDQVVRCGFLCSFLYILQLALPAGALARALAGTVLGLRSAPLSIVATY